LLGKSLTSSNDQWLATKSGKREIIPLHASNIQIMQSSYFYITRYLKL
jgi:hypothetical protein